MRDVTEQFHRIPEDFLRLLARMIVIDLIGIRVPYKDKTREFSSPSWLQISQMTYHTGKDQLSSCKVFAIPVIRDSISYIDEQSW